MSSTTARAVFSVLVSAFFLLGGKNSTPATIPIKKKNRPAPEPEATPGFVLVLGDSQSVAETSPGRRMARGLTAAGHPARVLAKGGKTAAYFVGKGGGAAELRRELAAKPSAVVVFLGSNEAANVAAFPNKEGNLSQKQIQAQLRGHVALYNLIQTAGARAIFLGPPKFGPNVKSEAGGRPLNDGAAALVPGWSEIYGVGFIDARPLTPEHKGVHFFDKGSAEAFAAALLPALVAKL